MRRVKTVGVCISGFIFGAAMYACGGDDATTAISGNDGGASDDATSASDTSVITKDGSAPTDASTLADGAIVIIDGGVASNPGLVNCGATACAAGSFCCADPADGGFSCQNGGGACPAGAGQLRCDETADCNGGPVDAGPQVCCYETNGDSGISSSCHADCNGGGGNRFQACKAQSECATGTCAAHACLDGQNIESCEPKAPICP